jgi:hypothetical protein
MQPILFRFVEARNKGRKMLGCGPSLQGGLPLPSRYLSIVDSTADGPGAPLGSCTVTLFRTKDDAKVDQVVSDPTTGQYEFRGSPAPATDHYAVAYKSGSPDLTGSTTNKIQGSGS